MQSHLKRIMRDTLRMYFAPLTGAWKGIREEYSRLDAEAQQRREQETKAQASRANSAER